MSKSSSRGVIEYRKRLRGHVWGNACKPVDFGMLGTMCSVAKEFDGFMIPTMEQLLLLANTVAGGDPISAPASPVQPQLNSESRRAVGRPRKRPRPPFRGARARQEGQENDDFEMYEQDDYFVQQQQRREQEREREQQYEQQPYELALAHYPTATGSKGRKVSAHFRRHEPSAGRADFVEQQQDPAMYQPHPAAMDMRPYSHPSLQQYPPQQQVKAAPPRLPSRPKRDRRRAAARRGGEQTAIANRERQALAQAQAQDKAQVSEQAAPREALPPIYADPDPQEAGEGGRGGGGVQMLNDSELLYKHDCEEKIGQRMVSDRQLLFLTAQLQKAISALFSANAAAVHSFCHTVRNNYSSFHIVVFLIKEIMQQFRARRITHADMLELASIVFKDSPALLLEFRELCAESKLVLQPEVEEEVGCSAEGGEGPPAKMRRRVLTLESDLDSDTCDPVPHAVATSQRMCNALLGQQCLSGSAEEFLDKVRLRMGPEFRNFARLVAGAKYAFSEHLYMDLIAYIGRIKRILPGQFHHEFGVFFPMTKAYQVYPHLRFKGMAKQRLTVAKHEGAKLELLANQKTANEKLREKLAALRAKGWAPPPRVVVPAPAPAALPVPVPAPVPVSMPVQQESQVSQPVSGLALALPELLPAPASKLRTHEAALNMLQSMQPPAPQTQESTQLSTAAPPPHQLAARMQTQQQLVWQQQQKVFQQMQPQVHQLQAQQP